MPSFYVKSEIRIFRKLVGILLKKIGELFEEQGKFLKIERNPTEKSIILDFQISENFEKIDGICHGRKCVFSIPSQFFSKFHEGKQNQGLFLNVVAHEIFHVFGALHADDGIMSGHADILEGTTNLDQFFIGDFIDPCTFHILKLAILGDEKRIAPNTINVRLIEENRVKIRMENVVNFAVFAEKTFYTSSFNFPKSNEFLLIAPENWDTLVLACEKGCVLKLAKKPVGFNMSYAGFL